MTAQKQTAHAARLRKTVLVIAALALALFGVAAGYTLFYSMGAARSLEMPGSLTGPRVLIATQGSAFKDAVVNGLLDHLKRQFARVRVIDVASLPTVNETEWDALVVIHTWQMRKPPVQVQAFVDRIQQRNKLVVLTTSGAGNFKLEGVDAISTASKMTDVATRVSEMAQQIDAILGAARPSP